MMEYGLFVTDSRELPADPRTVCSTAWREILPAGTLRALYFGSEFCIDLLPTPDRCQDVCQAAQKAGVEAVLLTPVVPPRGIDKLKQLLSTLTTDGRTAPTVVFNDWGVASLLQHSFPLVRRRTGRLMNRALRDPRVAETPGSRRPVSAGRAVRMRSLLVGMGVVAVETDPDLEGSYLGDGREGLQRVVHLPYSFVATGRQCLTHYDLVHRPAESFPLPLDTPCYGYCRGRVQRVERADCRVPLWRSGNTIFCEASEGMAVAHIRLADRIVLYEQATA